MINEQVETEIIDYGNNAEGIARINGKVVFIPFVLKGEKVLIKIVQEKKDFLIGRVLKIIEKSPFRTEPPCPYFINCGGCQLQHTTYEESLNIKTQIVKSTLEKFVHSQLNVKECIGSKKTYQYRNKLALPISPKFKSVGMFKEASHTIIPIADCIIQEKWAKDLIEIFNQYLKLSGASIYNELTQKGEIRHLVARSVNDTLLVTVVSNSKNLNNSQILISLLKTKFKNFGLNLNINTAKNNVIMSENFVQIYGVTEIPIVENDIIYSINNQSFLQVNDEIKEKIYSLALEQISSNSTVIDAYSGAGFLTAMLSKKAKFVYGIEIVKPATELANKLIMQNKIKNVTNINGDCSQKLPELINSLPNKNVTVVLDPPRKGCDRSVINALLNSNASQIVYISCNPSTLARDVELLLTNYKIQLIQPFDMFPQTKHVETLVVLNK